MTTARNSLTFLYRGSFSACNYACDYCPFAKTDATDAVLETDRRELKRFVEHIESGAYRNVSLMFIPWGEALVHEHYQQAMVSLSRCASVQTVVVQTNLSIVPHWIRNCDHEKIALWCTFHPTQTDVNSFLHRLEILEHHAVRYSVGVVGRDDLFDDAMLLRNRLPSHVTMWVNPLDDDIKMYSPELLKKWSQIDPLFPLTAKKRLTAGTKCRCGNSVFTISGNGDLHRCPFAKKTLGHLYAGLLPKNDPSCPNECCDCFIGYIHWESDSFRKHYAEPPMARITHNGSDY